ncbi:MAG TPA: putative molybdenum carrier protein [Candidatus Competibacter sp.]|nr:putative molybdenum carrier protein [Candidatus Competibacter sp.]
MIDKIISGGQTGVDRAGLDVALALGLSAGGWCPQGRLAEDGTIPDRYPLMETLESDYEIRTRRNVEDSDGTLILNRGALDGGTALTADYARQIGKPCLIVALEEEFDPERFRVWLDEHRIRVLNVAGPRASKRPGVYAEAARCLEMLLRTVLSGGRSTAARSSGP